jgi:septal ring factor EnvC (AmiA/AmiB activator)
MRVAVVAACAVFALAPAGLRAQSADARLRNSKEELNKIHQEREALQKNMEALKKRAHSISDELQNLDREHDITSRAVQSLDRQLVDINDDITETTADLIRAQDEVTAKRAMLRQRLIDIYKRGPMYDVEALLSAESFGALVARYKYLHELAVRDRALVKRVEQLQTMIRAKRLQLVGLQGEISDNRSEKKQEEAHLVELEGKQKKSLVRVQQDAKKAQARLRELARAEARVNNIIADLETARRRGSSTRASSTMARGPSSIKTSDYGRLAWPVEGTILYNFGRVVNPNNTVTRWNGIGIAAPAGTPVRAVADGEVRAAEPMSLYGNTIIIEHGGGDYSVYASLASISVHVGSKVSKGQVIGTVGSSDPDQPPHLHFEIRHDGPAVDPTTWLRSR